MDDSEQPDSGNGSIASIAGTARMTFMARLDIRRPLQRRIQAAVKQSGSPQPVIETDYALGHILAGIAAHAALTDTLIFKGGTALKKLIFQDYRFSEDLDFSTSDSPKGEELEVALRQVVEATSQRLNDQQGPFNLEILRLTQRERHPHGQEAFAIRIQFPWQRSPLCKIKLEITHDEPILLAPGRRTLTHGYEEELSTEVLCYQLEEIVAEKLRALRQTHERLIQPTGHRKRPRARDYYDLWRLLGQPASDFQRKLLPDLLARKCAHCGVSFTSLDDFFTNELVTSAKQNWDATLGRFVRDLPPCEEVLDELRRLVPEFLPGLLAY